MNRRDALSAVALLMGGTIVGANLFLTGCKSEDKKTPTGADLKFSASDLSFLDEVAETIIPETDTPGAKAAKVGAFMEVMVRDCYSFADQEVFVNGITTLQKACQEKFGKDFMDLKQEEKTTFLTALDQEQKDHQKNKKGDEPKHYFRMMKELTLLGYFTSEVGATKALRYIETPGKYDGNYPYKKGDKAFAL